MPPSSSPKERGEPETAETAALSLGEKGKARAPESFYALAPGTVIAEKYRIEEVIGQGGMGVVMRARHLVLDIPVAVKILSPEFVGSSEVMGRFLREARAASTLQNHHVTRVLDVGTLGSGEPYMVMEFLAGEDLARRGKRARLEIFEAVDYVAQASEAIAEAHAAGIIHRDVKPANLFLTKRHGSTPHVKVLDFGVSKVVSEGDGDVRLTQTTTILGSALYMSPEQMRSSKYVDRRTDVYALGACLFELLAGEPPYNAPSFPELCAKVFDRARRPLRELRPEVPAGLVAVIEKALARSPDDRYQSIAELVQALSPYAEEPTRAGIKALLAEHAPELDLLPEAPMPGRRAKARRAAAPAEKGERSWGVVLMVLLLVAAGSAAVYWKTVLVRRRAPPPPRAVVAAPPAAPASAPASVTVPASVPASAAAPASALAPASASASASAPLPAAHSAGPRAPVTHTAPRAAAPEPPPRADGPPPSVPPAAVPKVDSSLDQETCYQVLPDGSRHVVPCP